LVDGGRDVIPEAEADDKACRVVSAVFPVVQSIFYGISFCGKRDSLPFLEAERVDPGTERCPGTTLPCSPKTSDENTICMEPSDT